MLLEQGANPNQKVIKILRKDPRYLLPKMEKLQKLIRKRLTDIHHLQVTRIDPKINPAVQNNPNQRILRSPRKLKI